MELEFQTHLDEFTEHIMYGNFKYAYLKLSTKESGCKIHSYTPSYISLDTASQFHDYIMLFII